MQFKRTAKQISKLLSQMPKFWDGKQAILEMREAGYPHWRQMEWIGFYFQYLCGKQLLPTINTFANYVEIEGSKAGWIMPKRAIC